MSRSAFSSLVFFAALAALVSGPGLASAQAPQITVHDLTVDGDPPPSEYRTLLDAAIQRALVPIRACYDTSLRAHPGLHGELPLRMWVSARQAIRVTLESHLGDATLETCVHDRVHEFTLPPQAPDGGAAVHFTMTFTAGTPPPVASTTPTTPSTTTPSVVASTPTVTTAAPAALPYHLGYERLRGALSQETLEYVYARAGFGDCTTTQTGTFPITITITADGHARASAGRGTLRDAAYRTCMVQHVTSATYPPGTATTRLRLTVTR